MIILSNHKYPMPEQPLEVRTTNFLEVSQGYTEEMAISEAMRCLKCRKHPCMDGCPVHNRIPDFLAEVAKGEFEEAYHVLTATTSLPAVCGRVCQQEVQCEGKCVRGTKGEPVGIGRVEAFVADWHREHYPEGHSEIAPSNGHKVAIIGAGPAGIACAGDLIKKGYDVTVYDSLKIYGGVVAYGIPEFVLPNDIVDAEVEKLKARGVKFLMGTTIGPDYTIDEMMEEGQYEALFIATGAEQSKMSGVTGEDTNGVVSANEYLIKVNIDKYYEKDSVDPVKTAKKVAVIGGGNTAIDVARAAIRMGAETYIVYRRSLVEMPARAEEVVHALEEGVHINYLCNPSRIISGDDGRVKAMECIRMELGEPDSSGRKRPIPIEGSEFMVDVDLIVMALGYEMDDAITSTKTDLELDRWGNIRAGDKAETNLPGIFAGGDVVSGPATVVKAMGAGKIAAAGIDEYIMGKTN